MRKTFVSLCALLIAGCQSTEPTGAAALPGLVEIDLYADADTEFAEVYIDDHFVGNGNVDLPLSPGDHELKVKLAGHVTFKKDIHVLAGAEEQEFNVLLEPKQTSWTTDGEQ